MLYKFIQDSFFLTTYWFIKKDWIQFRRPWAPTILGTGLRVKNTQMNIQHIVPNLKNKLTNWKWKWCTSLVFQCDRIIYQLVLNEVLLNISYRTIKSAAGRGLLTVSKNSEGNITMNLVVNDVLDFTRQWNGKGCSCKEHECRQACMLKKQFI